MSSNETRSEVLTGTMLLVDSANPEAKAALISTYKTGIIHRLKVKRTAGSGRFTVTLYQHSVSSDVNIICQITLNTGTLLDEAFGDLYGTYYKNQEGKSQVKLLIAPLSGAANSFSYQIFVEDRV